MQLVINGQSREVSAESLAELLVELQLDTSHVAVELNQAIVESSQFATTALNENDRLEVIQFVGGG
ncbi:MAG TPA: sulfur carrier protein ThiS [Geothermobacteraceae bacterium]|nr:sulfur carrier protein ThiS [Geothermobacteraceae bacterium]